MLMEQERKQKVLREKIIFRSGVLLLSVVICILYILYNKYYPAIWGVALGIAGSALVWSLVEIVDFFINTDEVFEEERSQFFGIVETHWSELKDCFRNTEDAQDVDWDKVFNKIDDIYNDVAMFPFKGSTYSISKEFEDAAIYITRLYWIAHGYKYSTVEKGQDYWDSFYNIFVKVSDHPTENYGKDLKKIGSINQKIDELRKIELSFDDFSYPKGMIDNRDIGNLGKNFSLTSGKWRYKTFKPIYDFHEKFHIDTKYGTFLVVKGILRRKIKQWDKVDDGKGKGK